LYKTFEDDAIMCSRAVIGFLLVASGATKLLDVTAFAAIVRGFALLPSAIASALGRLIPLGECLSGGILLVAVVMPGSPARWAGAIAVALFVVFGGAVGINLARDRRNISCGCLGFRHNDQISWALVLRNCVLGAVAYIAFQRAAGYSGEGSDGTSRAGAALIGLSILLVWQISMSISQLWAYKQENHTPIGDR
jgi:hypothetical protein